MNYLGLTQNERRYEIMRALTPILAALEEPVTTGLIVDKLARAMGLSVSVKSTLATDVTRVARIHPAATHDGESFKHFNRLATRWRWHPTKEPVTLAAETAPSLPWWIGSAVQAAMLERDDAGDLTERAGVLRDAIEFWRSADV